jgi:membrane dipeptidase
MHKRWMNGGLAALMAMVAAAPGVVRAGGDQGQAAAPAAQQAAAVPADAALLKKAHAIHDKVIALDTHDDISPANFTAERNYTQRLDTQVNLPKMVEGGLDASFFIAYTGQGPLTPEGYDAAYKEAIAKFDAVHRLTEQIAPDKIQLALTSADVRRINASGKKVALIGIENGYPLGDDEAVALKRVKEFYDRGGRYMSLAHNGHSQLSDSNTGEREGWKWNGLSPLGKKVIVEMNKVGIMVDVSHPSKQSMMQAIALSKAPIIASHSGVRALADVSRNMDDEQLLALKKNGGVIQVVAFNSYVKTDSPERKQALEALAKEFGLPPGTQLGGRGGRGGGRAGAAPAADAPAAGAPAAPANPVAAAGGRQGGGRANPLAQLSPEKQAELQTRLTALNEKFPPPTRATVQDFVNHIDYAVKKIGLEHVGISSDFDGGGGIDGWNGAEETFNVTLELVRRGYTEEQIGKLWSGNLLRVMDEVQKIAAKS